MVRHDTQSWRAAYSKSLMRISGTRARHRIRSSLPSTGMCDSIMYTKEQPRRTEVSEAGERHAFSHAHHHIDSLIDRCSLRML